MPNKTIKKFLKRNKKSRKNVKGISQRKGKNLKTRKFSMRGGASAASAARTVNPAAYAAAIAKDPNVFAGRVYMPDAAPMKMTNAERKAQNNVNAKKNTRNNGTVKDGSRMGNGGKDFGNQTMRQGKLIFNPLRSKRIEKAFTRVQSAAKYITQDIIELMNENINKATNNKGIAYVTINNEQKMAHITNPAHPLNPMYKSYFLIKNIVEQDMKHMKNTVNKNNSIAGENRVKHSILHNIFADDYFKDKHLINKLIRVCKLVAAIDPTIPYYIKIDSNNKDELIEPNQKFYCGTYDKTFCEKYIKPFNSPDAYVNDKYPDIGVFASNFHSAESVYEPDDLYYGIGGIAFSEDGNVTFSISGTISYNSKDQSIMKCAVLHQFLKKNLLYKLDNLTQIIFDHDKNKDSYNCKHLSKSLLPENIKIIMAAKNKVMSTFKEFINSVTLDIPNNDFKDLYSKTVEFPNITNFLLINYMMINGNDTVNRGKELDKALCWYGMIDPTYNKGAEMVMENTPNMRELYYNSQCVDVENDESINPIEEPKPEDLKAVVESVKNELGELPPGFGFGENNTTPEEFGFGNNSNNLPKDKTVSLGTLFGNIYPSVIMFELMAYRIKHNVKGDLKSTDLTPEEIEFCKNLSIVHGKITASKNKILGIVNTKNE